MANHRARREAAAVINEFADDHLIRVTKLLAEEKEAIDSIRAAVDALNKGYTLLDEKAYGDPAIGLLLNMLHRNFEHVEAAVVACVTGSGASAEVIARAAFESSVNIIYILAGDRIKRLGGYFHHYLRETNRQVAQWQRRIAELPPSDQPAHAEAALSRQTVTDHFEKMVGGLLGTSHEPWPNTAERFDRLGLAIDYRTFYSRLSAETHADAEETLRYFFGKTHPDPAVFSAMAIETIMFSRFLVYSAITMFIKACKAYVVIYSLPEALPKITAALDTADKKLLEIAPHVGGVS